MFRLVLLGFLCLCTTFSCDGDIEEIKHLRKLIPSTVKIADSMQAQQNFYILIRTSEASHRVDILFINPTLLNDLDVFLKKSRPFEIVLKGVFNPSVYERLRPRNPSYPSINNIELQQKFQELLNPEKKDALGNINALANKLLVTLNHPSSLFVGFNHIYLCDREILHSGLRSFFGIINNEKRIKDSPEHMFMMAFSQIWKNLRKERNDFALNIALHQYLGEIIEHPSHYCKEFQQDYPSLTAWLERHSSKPNQSTILFFTLSFMHALAPKTYLPFAMQTVLAQPQISIVAPPKSPYSAFATPKPRSAQKSSGSICRIVQSLNLANKLTTGKSKANFGPYFEGFEKEITN